MKYTIADAIHILKPGSEYNLLGEDYSGLEWLDSVETKPTETEINNKISELDAAEPMRLLREERFRLLSECDWTQGADVPDAIKLKWQSYRQALRDITNAATTADVVWPTEPS